MDDWSRRWANQGRFWALRWRQNLFILQEAVNSPRSTAAWCIKARLDENWIGGRNPKQLVCKYLKDIIKRTIFGIVILSN